MLERAYSDHYSDVPMLQMAHHVTVVDPDAKLERISKQKGWEIADWDE